jgi:hypothetical protein
MVSMYEPPAHLAHLVEGFECAESETARRTANLLSGPTRLVPFILGGDVRTRMIPEAFLEQFNPSTAEIHGQADAAVLTILATSRPGDLWIGDDSRTPEVVAELIAEDLHCDARLLDGSDFGSCVDRHNATANGYASVNGETDRGRYIREHFYTVPFDRGGTIVMCRVCDWCLSGLLHSVDANRCGVLDPIDDGFGSVGTGPIRQSEYRWDTTHVRSIIDELRESYGRNPTMMELSDTLLTREFKPTSDAADDSVTN